MKFNNGPRPTEQLKLKSIRVLEVPAATAVSQAVQLTATKGYHYVQRTGQLDFKMRNIIIISYKKAKFKKFCQTNKM
jgi:hypothetical protein